MFKYRWLRINICECEFTKYCNANNISLILQQIEQIFWILPDKVAIKKSVKYKGRGHINRPAPPYRRDGLFEIRQDGYLLLRGKV